MAAPLNTSNAGTVRSRRAGAGLQDGRAAPPQVPASSPAPGPGGGDGRGAALRRLAVHLDRRISPYLYIAPFFGLFAVFGLFPILYTAFVSLHDWDIIGDRSWIGLGNYVDLSSDPRFWTALRNTISIWVLSTVPQLFAALGLAHVLNDVRLRGRKLFRLALLLPYVTSMVAVAIIFESIFGLRYGLITTGLNALGLEPIHWQAGVLTSHIAISAMIMFRWTGYNAIIYLAGLQGIPRELYEAAEIDGAGRWQQFWHVTIPLLRPVITFTVIVSTIGGLQIFTEALIFNEGVAYTGGSDRQFSTLQLFVYEMGFRRFDFGYASAITWVLVMLTALLVIVNAAWSRGVRLPRRGQPR